MTSGHTSAGLVRKYDVRRMDRRDVEGQDFFVLRIDLASEDTAAFAALKAYADALDWRQDRELRDALLERYYEWLRD